MKRGDVVTIDCPTAPALDGKEGTIDNIHSHDRFDVTGFMTYVVAISSDSGRERLFNFSETELVLKHGKE